MLATTLEADPYLGRLLTGRIERGTVTPNMPVKALSRDGKEIEQGRITKLLAFRGLKRLPIDEAEAGDIVAIAGLDQGHRRRHHLRSAGDRAAAGQPIDPPTIAMTFSVNDSPLAGREGDKVTAA